MSDHTSPESPPESSPAPPPDASPDAAESAPDTEPGAGADAEHGAAAGTETKPETGTETGTETEPETGTKTEPETGTETEPETGTETEPGGDVDERVSAAQAAMDEARRRVIEAPAEVIVVNHVMGLYELAAIHLSSPTPDLRSASLAIDAVACLVDGLGDRLGPETSTMRDALTNIRLAFVQVKNRPPAPSGEEASGGP